MGTAKRKEGKTNDGKDLGKIDKASQNYFGLEKGHGKKDKFWVPKYYADSYDGKVIWLSEEEERIRFVSLRQRTATGTISARFRYFQVTSCEKDWDLEKVDVTKELRRGVSSKPGGNPVTKMYVTLVNLSLPAILKGVLSNLVRCQNLSSEQDQQFLDR